MLVVCGDSFSYGIQKVHWPRMVANHLGEPLINLSIVGCSNFAICHQINYALQNYTPSLLVVSLSSADRFEIDSDDCGNPATVLDFEQRIDEIDLSYSEKLPTIVSGSTLSHIKNNSLVSLTSYNSFRLNAQNQAWAINYLLRDAGCKTLLYRNIFPQYHKDRSLYSTEHYYGLENFINSGPYDFESEPVKTTNHLSLKDNQLFAERVIADNDNY